MAHVIPTRRHGLSIVLVLVVLAAVGAALWWAGQRDDHAGPSPTGMPAAPTQAPAPGSPAFDAARTQLAQLRVKGWDREQNFERFRFGERWSDDVNVEFGHNGCNTRDDILRRDIIQDLMCRFALDFADYQTRCGEKSFADYFAAELADLQILAQQNLLQLSADGIRVSAKGRLLIRNIAMVFDYHLRHRDTAAKYSQTV